MDEMQQYEVQTIVDNLSYVDRGDWERTRMGIYSYVQSNTKKKLTVKDIITFPWEKENEVHDTEISTQDIQRLREMAKNIKLNTE